MLSLLTVSVEMGLFYFTGDDYYAESDGDSLGSPQFRGKGSQLLGIEGDVDEAIFSNLLEGFSPDGRCELIDEKRVKIDPSELLKRTKKFRETLDNISISGERQEYLKRLFSESLFGEGRGAKTFELYWEGTSGSDDEIYAIGRKERRELRATINHSLRAWHLPAAEKDRLRKTIQTYFNFIGKSGHRGGVDATFSAPKSVSLAALLGKDRRLIEAHKEAVDYALSHLEKKAVGTRVGPRNDRVFQNTENLVAARFNHGTSREGDPQLHSHCVIFNMTQRKDGAWRSFFSDRLFEHSKLLGVIYQNKLAELSQKLGYEIETKPNGTFEIKGYSNEALQAFSKRRKQVLEGSARQIFEAGLHENLIENGFGPLSVVRGKTRFYSIEADKVELERLGFAVARTEGLRCLVNDYLGEKSFSNVKAELLSVVTQKHNRQGVLRDRPLKNEIPSDSLASKWRQEAADLEMSHPIPTGTLSEWGKPLDTVFAVEHLSEKDALFRPLKLETEALTANLGRATYETIRKALSQNIQLVEIDGKTAKTEKKFTTLQELSKEEAVIRMVRNGFGKSERLASSELAGDLSDQKDHTDGQRTALSLAVSSKDQFMAWVGVAGSRKTSTLRDVKDFAEVNGYKVFALGADAATAKQLGKDLDSQSSTVDRFLLKNRHQTRDERFFYIIDESSKLSTDHAFRLLTLATENGARVLFVGDTKQLGSVRAGNPFALMCNNGIAKATLSEHLRQETKELRDIVETARTEPSKAIELMLPHLKERKTAEARINVAVREYMSRSPDDRQGSLILCDTNIERCRLTKRLREKLQQEGSLDRSEFTIKTLQAKGLTQAQKRLLWNYDKGDIVVFNSDPRSRFLVEGVNKKSKTVSLRDLSEGGIIEKKALDFEFSESFAVQSLSVAKGDVLQWRRNHEGRINRELVTVFEIGRNEIKLLSENGRRESIPLANMHFLDYGLVQTTYASQGRTCDRVIAVMGANASRNSLYVALSRAKQEAMIITDHADSLRQRVERVIEKENSLFHAKTQIGWEKAIIQPVCVRELVTPLTREIAERLLSESSIKQRKDMLTKIATAINGVEFSQQVPTKNRFAYQKKAETLVQLGDFSDASLSRLQKNILSIKTGVDGRMTEEIGKNRERSLRSEHGLDFGPSL